MEKQIPEEKAQILVAVDLGSNSFHLGIARVIDGVIQPMHKVKQRVQLAENSDSKGNLSAEAMERGLACLTEFSQRLSQMHFHDIRIVATYALRSAPNRKEFIRKARKILGYPIEVIPGKEEARLIYAGVSQNQQIDNTTLVIDIGGGSTELIIGEGQTPHEMESLSMGCVSYQSRFFENGQLSHKRMKKAILTAEQQIEMLQQRYLNHQFEAAIGCSGTIKAIASIINHDDLSRSIHLEQLEQLKDAILEHDNVDTLPFPELAELRRKVLPSGLAILIACFRQLNIEQMQFSDDALREGVLSEMADGKLHHNIQAHTISYLQHRYQLDNLHSRQIHESAVNLYRQFDSKKKRLKPWLDYAANLHEIGLQINYRSIHKHGEYIINNINLPGFNLEEQQLLAFLIRWHRKKLTDCEPPLFEMLELDELWPLLISLRLSVIMHLGRRHHIPLPKLKQTGEQEITLSLDEELAQSELFIADLELEQEHLSEIGWRLNWQ